MWIHATSVKTLSVIAMASTLMFFANPTAADGQPAAPVVAPQAVPTVVEVSAESPDTALYPKITIEGGSAQQRARFALALSRFRAVRLELPDLDIVFSSDNAACRGYYGLYENGAPVPRVTFCSEIDFVYEHELAHAWEAHSATDQKRRDFMELRGLTVWSNADVAWGDRGIEDAAFIIQQVVSGSPLPPVPGEEFMMRSAAFELLTGQPDPRLEERGPSVPDAFSPHATIV